MSTDCSGHNYQHDIIIYHVPPNLNNILKLYKTKLGLGVNPFPNKPWFLCVSSTSPLKTLWEREKLLVTSDHSFSHSVFCPGELFAILIKFEIVICKLSQFGSLKFVVWERVNTDTTVYTVIYNSILYTGEEIPVTTHN